VHHNDYLNETKSVTNYILDSDSDADVATCDTKAQTSKACPNINLCDSEDDVRSYLDDLDCNTNALQSDFVLPRWMSKDKAFCKWMNGKPLKSKTFHKCRKRWKNKDLLAKIKFLEWAKFRYENYLLEMWIKEVEEEIRVTDVNDISIHSHLICFQRKWSEFISMYDSLLKYRSSKLGLKKSGNLETCSKEVIKSNNSNSLGDPTNFIVSKTVSNDKDLTMYDPTSIELDHLSYYGLVNSSKMFEPKLPKVDVVNKKVHAFKTKKQKKKSHIQSATITSENQDLSSKVTKRGFKLKKLSGIAKTVSNTIKVSHTIKVKNKRVRKRKEKNNV